jgi:DNA-binding transcriptional MerR regulator
MTQEDHRSIGEVLSELRDEFPDVTISKIRFLESQGLIAPERTPSGYRKFYPGDVERLRWVLHQQKDNFLPLKVIRERLDAVELGAPGVDEAPPEPRVEAPILPPDDDDHETPPGRAAPATGASLTREELGRAAGIDDDELAELESYGLIVAASTETGRVLFDEEALAIARTAASFGRRGIEARHLRMYRTYAEREAGLFEQVLAPYLRQRNPEARAKAQDELAELARLGRTLRAALLRQAVRRTWSG